MSNIVLSFWLGILRLILTFLHLVYSGLQYFDLAWALFKRKFEEICTLPVMDAETYVSRFVINLEKCPSHLAVIVGSESINLEDFSNVVIWCLAAGISFVSFYDHTGYLRENESIYFRYLFEKRKLNPKCVISNSNKEESKNGFKLNGMISQKRIHINIVALEDGKMRFAEMVKQLSKQALLKEVHCYDINEVLVSKKLYNLTGYSDPELAVVCGKVLGTFGFLPWQVRVTEFMQVRTLRGIQVSEFLSILKSYANCQQRFGK